MVYASSAAAAAAAYLATVPKHLALATHQHSAVDLATAMALGLAVDLVAELMDLVVEF